MDKELEKYPAVLNVAQVAEILHVTEATVRKMISERKLPSVKVGRLIRIPKSKLIEYFEAA